MKASLFVPLLTAAFVSAHGYIHTLTINGRAYNGNPPQAKQVPSILRQISTPFPNKGAMNPALTCGPDATPAALVADANPGDTLTFDWRAQDLGKWPHNTGPMLTYMAKCPNTCDKVGNPSTVKWFKIGQQGRKNGNGDFFQADLMTGGVATATIPANLAPGNYLIRHEIIALHLATMFNGAEFYPGCAQVKVGGSQTGVPKDSDLVTFPGAYSDNDPGIFDPSVFDNNAKYVFPGPNIATLVNTGSSGATPSSATPSGNSGNSTSTRPPKSSTSKSCKAKRSSDVRKRRLSRVIQRRNRYRSNPTNSPSRK